MIDILKDIEDDILEVSSCNRANIYIFSTQSNVYGGAFLQKGLQFSAVNQFYKDTYGTNVSPATLTQF